MWNGTALFWNLHRRRLEAALEALALQLPCPWEAIEHQINTLAANLSEGRLKLILARCGGGAYTPPTRDALLWLMGQPLSEMASYPLGPYQRLILYPYRLLVETPWSRFKTLSALPYVQAAHYATEKGFTDALLLSVDGYLAETTRANLFWFDGEMLHTPPLSSGAVEGVLRTQILSLLPLLGLRWQETGATPEALAQAQELFTTNVIQGIAPVVQLTVGGQTYFYSESVVIPHLVAGLRQVLTPYIRRR